MMMIRKNNFVAMMDSCGNIDESTTKAGPMVNS